MLTDTHCHLNFRNFDNDRNQVLARAEDEDVRRILNPGVNIGSSKEALNLAGNFQTVYPAVGIHPNEHVQLGRESLLELRTLAMDPAVIAIGEIGLDYYRKTTPPDEQKYRFRTQLDLAAEMELPVIIHCRDAHSDTLKIVTDWQEQGGAKVNPGVFHSFSGDEADARAVIALGFYLGIAGQVTFPRNEGLRKLVAKMPEDRLLIETDAPFLAPQPQRGHRNEPAFVRYIAEEIATARKTTTDTIAQASTTNANNLFSWNY